MTAVPAVKFRLYDAEQDKKNARRIWKECGWLDDSKKQQKAFDEMLAGHTVMVAEVNNSAECLTMSAPGELFYLNTPVKTSFITGVTTSHIARKQGLAGRLTADLIAQNILDEQAALATLGIFEQGFYNQMGFGSGGYEHWISFSPAQLKINTPPRIPDRLSQKDARKMHQCRLQRHKPHGGCNLIPDQITRTEMQWAANGFGLGYHDGPNWSLSHFLWMNARDVENGPYNIWWMAYQNYDQFIELMGILRNLGDQVRMVSLREPMEIQFQDLLEKPFYHRSLTEKSKFAQINRASSYYQFRICDLDGCLRQTHLPFGELRFNLKLTDPIERFFSPDSKWNGIAGDYIVRLGPESGAEPGTDPDLSTMETTVNAFTRLWLGVKSASGLQVTEKLIAPPELLRDLDQILRLPPPTPDWDY